MNKIIIRHLIIGIICIVPARSSGENYMVSTVTELTTALGKVAGGDTIFIRAGTYASTKTISLSKSGTSVKPICFMVNPGDERPLFDFSGTGSSRGFSLSGSYWHIKGIRVHNAGDNGMIITGDNNTVEYCDFFENGDSGCQLGGGASNNRIINCDAYYNRDFSEGNADGFSPKLDVGSGNYFKGCRAWQNSDDGFDGYLRPSDDVTTTYEECWCYKNGYRKDGTAGTGNGNGFKMGGSDNKALRHNVVLKNCLSAGNRVTGFDQNNTKGSMTLYNCTAFSNGINYGIDGTVLASGKTLTLTNCISAGKGAVSLKGGTITTCSWSNGISVSNKDFISVDSSAMTGPRKSDGSLPEITFMHLAPTSALIDAGTPIDSMAFAGSKPDLGCFETGTGTGTILLTGRGPSSFFKIVPVSPDGLFKIILPVHLKAGVNLMLSDLSGRRVMNFRRANSQAAGSDIVVDLRRSCPGNYLCRVGSKDAALVKRVVRR